MKIEQKPRLTFALSAIAALLCTAALAASAAASPVWKFNGAELVGSETTLSHATESSLTIPGLTTTCEPFVYGMTISNSSGTGKGSITEVPLSNCFTSSKFCTVKTISAEKLPWAAGLSTISSSHYLTIEGVRLSILYGGALCALNETVAVITGSAGGLIDNATESVTFNAASFAATKTALKAFGQTVEWTGTFTMLGTGAHIGESLTVS
ncbi:MAG TPA: hypothetical protein VFT10_10000 [Solirubrobacterales bacterium]|nr:hypothetical protein [Solirubrobacterales bacterium]